MAPSRGSRQLCAWRTDLAPGSDGAPHTVSHEEVFLVLHGSPTVTLDGRRTPLAAGDVVLVPEAATVQLDNHGDGTASLWVTTSVGLTATTADGGIITPPWTR
ncbi:cupin domain-containing protein [Rhodococcus sp. TAF43]|uniref:cupin domain-containing protein n=1 Tax=unclassified Rhodococcus (in: high G+C Gram-positive bacteria) TaxID=192944 RepID=UPI0020C73A81|nr:MULTISPECIES: cupin domain-containing protein [unclassified Rhodococcus (in: high G+C Gram-positive bacteria)]